MVLHVHKDRVDKLNLVSIANEFVGDSDAKQFFLKVLENNFSKMYLLLQLALPFDSVDTLWLELLLALRMVTGKMYHGTKGAVPGTKRPGTQYQHGQYQVP